ncbi:MAG TPA: biotin/lipoyl-containing protein, partial [Gemmatimonadaceae bacterium]|nr:biotin/lipoyl-containing protein [Gemmatimonadaceae bacterium]
MISIKVPPLGESIVEATVGRWIKQEGEAVAAGDTLVELETDKVNVDVAAPKAGAIAKRLAKEGEVVKVDQPLLEFDETAAGVPAPAAAVRAPAAAPAAPTPAAAASASQDGRGAAGGAGAPAKVSPAAQRVAAERG